MTVLLRGGPVGLSGRTAIPTTRVPERAVLDYRGRHEHFEFTGVWEDADGARVPVFRWVYSTAIAE